MDGYIKNREKQYKKIEHLTDTTKNPLNFDTMHDLEFYDLVEKRGHYAWLKGVAISYDSLYHYSVRMMTEKESPVWIQIERPKVGERFGKSALQTTK